MACERHGTTSNVLCKYCDAESVELYEMTRGQLVDAVKDLRATITRLEGERDEWKQAAEEMRDRYDWMRGLRDTCAEERTAAYLRVRALTAERGNLLEALKLTDAALSGANMNMNVVQRKVRAALQEPKA